MRRLSFIGLAALVLAGCDTSKPVQVESRRLPVEQLPVDPVPVDPLSGNPVRVNPAPPADVEVGGPQGGIHVNDPAGGTQVEIGGGKGIQVRTPDSNVNVP